MPNSLYDQLTPNECNVAACLLGFKEAGNGFRNNLRDIPPFKHRFTIGDVCEAYAKFILTSILKRKEAQHA